MRNDTGGQLIFGGYAMAFVVSILVSIYLSNLFAVEVAESMWARTVAFLIALPLVEAVVLLPAMVVFVLPAIAIDAALRGRGQTEQES